MYCDKTNLLYLSFQRKYILDYKIIINNNQYSNKIACENNVMVKKIIYFLPKIVSRRKFIVTKNRNLKTKLQTLL